MASKTILALDQSSRVSGWAFFDAGDLVDFGHWTHEDTDFALRIHKLCQEIEEEIDVYDPEIILIENIQLQHGDVATFQKLAQVQGAILRLCAQKKKKYKLVYPSEWRAACDFLKGKEKTREPQKKIAQQWVATTYQMKCTQDESDAICIGYSEVLKADSEFDWSE